MDLVTDAGSWLAEPDAVLAGCRLQVEVVLHVLGLDVQDVVVGIAGGDSAADAGDTHRLKMQKGLCGSEVLGQDLIDPDADLFPGNQAAFGEVGLQNLAGQVLAHMSAPLMSRMALLLDRGARRPQPVLGNVDGKRATRPDDVPDAAGLGGRVTDLRVDLFWCS